MKNEIENYEYLQNQLRIGNWKLLSEFDEKLLEHPIAIFGIGGSGSPMALTLVRMGFRKVVLIDKDIVEKKNLTRQVLYSKDDIGKDKTVAAKHNLEKYHSFQTSIEVYQIDINNELDIVEKIINEVNFVFNLVDNDIALYHVAKMSRKLRKASIFFGTGIFAGMTSTLLYQDSKEGPCLACLRGFDTNFEELCEVYNKKNYGVTPSWYPTPSLGAAFAAVFLIKSLIGKSIAHNCITTSLYSFHVEKLRMNTKDGCKICGIK